MQPKLISSIPCRKTVKNTSKQSSGKLCETKFLRLYMLCMRVFHKDSETWIYKIVYKPRDVYILTSSFS